MLHAVVMAGGSGTRFWPESRENRPKQFLRLLGDRSMIQHTIDRLAGLVPPERTLVVTNRRLADMVAQQLPQLGAESIVSEPCRRDTAPCIGLAAALVVRSDPEATMVVLPADHVISPDAEFQRAIRQAVQLAEAGGNRLITFGIAPTYPSESFGYIERGQRPALPDEVDLPVYRVTRFREKPSAEVARQYLESGRFFWNSGIFVWKASTVLAALDQYEPEMASQLREIATAAGTPQFERVLAERFAEIRGRSIDYGVMEPAADGDTYEVLVVEAPFQWDDLGSWRALARLRGADAEGNTVDGLHLGLDTTGCVIRSSEEHLVVTLGVENLIIVHTPDATLVADVRREESIRRIVEEMRARGLERYL